LRKRLQYSRWLTLAVVSPLLVIGGVATAQPNGVATAQPNGGAAAQPEQAVSLTLQQALDAAADANIDVLSARNAEASAAADIRKADTSPNPQLSLNAAQLRPNRIGQPGAQNYGDTTVRIDQTIERGGKRRLRVAAARASLAAAHGDLGDTQRTVLESVAGAYFDLMAAERRQTLSQGIAETYRRSLDLMGKRLNAGDVSGGDMARARVEMLRAASDAALAGAARRDAQLALAVLIGRETDAARLATSGDWPGTAYPAPGQDADTIAEGRPDVVAAQSRAEAARRNLDGAHALRHRDVSVGLQYEHDANALGSTVGVGVSVPLFLGNRYTGEIDSAGVDVRQAEATAAKARAVAVAEILVARSAAASANDRRRQYDDDLVPAARHAADTAEFSYTRGALALLDLLDARRTLKLVEIEAIAARSDQAKAMAHLRAVQTLETE
jgi:cobalt-zinc-cadmium efflux system outer membrane protein